MSENDAPSSGAWKFHQWMQAIASGGVTLLTAAVIAGWGTWNDLQTFMIRNERVPADIKEIKEDISDVKNTTMSLGWRVTNIEATIKRK